MALSAWATIRPGARLGNRGASQSTSIISVYGPNIPALCPHLFILVLVMFSIRTSFSGLRKIELVDCPSAKELIKHGPSCDARK